MIEREPASAPPHEPIFNVPWPVLAVSGVLIALHVALQWMSVAEAERVLVALAFIPARYSGYAADIPGGGLASATAFVTHMLVHGDTTHLAINTAWFLAFGSVVCRRLGAAWFMAFIACAAAAGATAFLATHVGEFTLMIGASGAVAGLMGAVMRFLFTAIDRRQGYLLSKAPQLIALMPLGQTLGDRRVIVASALFIGINLLALVGFGLMGSAGAIAWEAHLGGYAFGLLAFGLFDPAAQHVSPSAPDLE